MSRRRQGITRWRVHLLVQISGVPMAHLILGVTPALGLILIPIMVYHPLKLAIYGVLAQRWAART